MTKIGLLSDTHGFVDDRLLSFFDSVDEIWHAGDIGNLEALYALKKFKPIKAVFGNIDGHEIRLECPKYLRFKCEQVEVLITHIGGYPGKYFPEVRDILKKNPPNLFICGHSHILKVIYDKKLDFMFMNPGAAGMSGFHKVRTAIRFCIDGKNFKDMEVLEIQRK